MIPKITTKAEAAESLANVKRGLSDCTEHPHVAAPLRAIVGDMAALLDVLSEAAGILPAEASAPADTGTSTDTGTEA